MSAARSFDEVAALDAVLIRIVLLRRLQQELRGQLPTEDEATEEEPVSLPRPSYRYGVRNTNPGQSRGRR